MNLSFRGSGQAVTRWVRSLGNRNRFWQLVIIVGLVSGLVGALYIGTLHVTTRLLGGEHWSDGPHLVVLALVGLAVGLITRFLGNPGDVELLVDNIHVNGGQSDIRDLRSLIPVSLLGIGAGSAIGPEAPLVQSTGSLGSWIATKQGLSTKDVRVLTITGMAAGFAVLFGAPLGSAVFALEILHRRGLQYYEALLPAALGALSGYAVYIVVNSLGMDPIWTFPSPGELTAQDLLVGLGAGIVGAVVAIAFTYLSHAERHVFGRIPANVRPLVGGLALGGMAFITPYALTFGEGQIQDIIDLRLAIGTLVLAAVVKLIASSTIISAGWRGGFIIPLFFIGAALGAVAARALDINAVVAMTACMAACNVGVTKTPVGSAIVVAEMSGMRLLPPTLLAAVVALFLTGRVAMIHTQRERAGSFDTEGLDQEPIGPLAAARAGRATSPG